MEIKRTITLILFVVLIVLAVGGVVYGLSQHHLYQKTSESDPVDDTSAIFSQTDVATPEKNQYKSARFDFFINVPKSYQYRIDPPTGNQLAFITLMTPNKDRFTIPDREGPKGVNTKLNHMVWIEVYPNQPHRNLPNEEQFHEWHTSTIMGRTVRSIEYQNTGGNGKFFIGTEEEDGVVSMGRYKYFFAENYVIVLGSDDLTKAELFDLAREFGAPGIDVFIMENDYE